jgi:hypothetical protein
MTTPTPDPDTLLALAARVELAETQRDRVLNREVALAVGWHRYPQSAFDRRSKVGWIASEDFCGEYVRKDGTRTPKLDSLHGTDIWPEPRDYLASLDAAMTLVPEGWRVAGLFERNCKLPNWIWKAELWHPEADANVRGIARNADVAAIAITAAALRARASTTKAPSDE